MADRLRRTLAEVSTMTVAEFNLTLAGYIERQPADLD